MFAPVSSQDLDFQRHMSWVIFMFNDLRLEVIVCFVDIGNIVHQHCLNFIFKNNP